MPQLIKTGSSVFKSGNNVFLYNRLLDFVSVETNITAAQSGVATPRGIALDPSNDRIFVCNYSTNVAIKILNYTDPKSGIFDTITAAQGGFSNPTNIVIDAASNRIFVTSIGNRFSFFNYTNPKAGSPTLLSLAGNLYGVGIDALGGRIFVSSDSGAVQILDYINPSIIIGTVTQAYGNFNSCAALALDAAGDRIFVLNRNSTMSILNFTNPTSVTPTMITGLPSGMEAISLDVPNNRIFIASGSTITILNYTDPSIIIGIVSAAQGNFLSCQGLALDTARNKIFATDRTGNAISIITNQFT